MKQPQSFACLAIVAATIAVGVLSHQNFVCTPLCSIDQPHSVVPNSSPTQCSLSCFAQPGCNDFNFNDETRDCSLYVGLHKPLLYANIPGCTGYKTEKYEECLAYGSSASSTIPSQCCEFPFMLNNTVHYQCVDDGGGIGCFYGNMEWKLCQQPADFVANYYETSTTVLSADPAVSVPLLTISSWILMQRKVAGGSVSFNQTWAAYRDGFGPAAGDDNYWLGLDKVYRLMQLSSVKLRVEIQRIDGLWYWAEYSMFSITDEVGKYRLTVDGYSGDAGNALMTSDNPISIANGMMFSTPDSDNDEKVNVNGGNCAAERGGGWWYRWCSRSLLNVDVQYGKWTIESGTLKVYTSRILVKVTP